MVTGSEMKMTSGVMEEAKCWSAVVVREFCNSLAVPENDSDHL